MGADPSGTRHPAGHLRPALVLAVTLALAACQRTSAPPAPGTSQGTPPDLRGRRVMLLPVQEVVGFRGTPDAELAFQLQGREPDVHWILPDRIQESLDRSPGIRAETRGLPVGTFLSSEVRRVGDPLYGELRRMAALVDGEVALIPVRAAAHPQEGGGVAIRLHAALIDVRTGRVAWFGVEEGDAGAASDPAVLASAVDALARTLLWYSEG
jgi:hypothetical protein